MKFYLAPLEGLTGYIYRNAYNTFFENDIDKYFSPFIAPNQHNNFKTREINDILPENNKNLTLIPQILTNNAEHFINTAKKLSELGYNEVNLNLGCPSGTVVAKGKGSGFLAKADELDAFLYEIFKEPVTKISVKTRIGKDDPEEFHKLLEIFNKYPIEELIIHPRTQKDFYKNTPNMDMFREAVNSSKNPLCYNGDIFTLDDYNRFTADFPNIDAIMLGRGVLYNPGLISKIKHSTKLEKSKLKEFHDMIYKEYQEVMHGDKNILFKMKEIWSFMSKSLTNSEKYLKKIKKSQRLSEYEVVVESLFDEQDII